MYFDVRGAGAGSSRGVQAYDRAQVARGPLPQASSTAPVAFPRSAIAGDHDLPDRVLSGVDEAGQRGGWTKRLRVVKDVILALMQPDQAVIDQWSGAAPFWEKHNEVIRQMFAPITQALIEDGLIGNRDAVLDIATGPGEPALSVAALVGPEGKVIGIDPVPEMVAAARRAADRMGYRNAQFNVAFADDLPFPADTFDAVVSRFGAMFFPSPVDAVREILRVLKPGRKLAMAVWSLAETNPFFYTLSQVIERYVDSPPPAPDAPDAFRFASPGKLREVLAEAGAMSPSERLLHSQYKHPPLWRTFGRCDAGCLRSFVKKSRCFPGSS